MSSTNVTMKYPKIRSSQWLSGTSDPRHFRPINVCPICPLKFEHFVPGSEVSRAFWAGPKCDKTRHFGGRSEVSSYQSVSAIAAAVVYSALKRSLWSLQSTISQSALRTSPQLCCLTLSNSLLFQ